MTGLQQLTALLGRILMAALFLWAGYGKLMNFSGTVAYATSAGLPMPQLGIIVAIIVELLFSLLFIIGFRIRLVALVMAVFTIATAVFFHQNVADTAQLTNFMKNVCIAGGFLQVVAFGGGSYSLDARRRR
jgi:putative oxidoreductase